MKNRSFVTFVHDTQILQLHVGVPGLHTLAHGLQVQQVDQ